MWRRGRLIGLGVCLAVLALGAWVEHAPLLQEAARVWMVSDPLSPADAVAVLGGGVNDRPFAAAAYYREGLVKKILLSNNRVDKAAALGAMPSDSEANRQVLLRLGIPESAIDTFGENSANTHDEALALRAWAQQTGARSIIVPTEFFSARRVRWTLHRVFGTGVTIIVPALDPPDYGPENWWHDENAIVAFQNEVLKYIYYRLRY